MSFGNPSNPTWGSTGGTGTALDMFLRQVLPGMLGQFRQNQNIVDTAEAQRFQSIQYGATMFAANNAQVVQSINALIEQTNQTLKQFGMNYSISNLSNQASAEAIGRIMPFASTIGGGVFDAVGLSAPAFTGALAESQRRHIYQQPGLDPTATGQRIGEIGKASYEQLYNTSGEPLGNTFGYKGGALGQLAAAGSGRGWGDNNLLQPGKTTQDAAKEHAAFAQRMGQLGSAVRDLGGPFAAMGAQQTIQAAVDLNLGGAHMTSEQMSAHIRRQKELGRMAGMDTGQVHGIQIQAGQFAKSIGLNASMATGTSDRALAERTHLQGMGDEAMSEHGTDLNKLTQKSNMLGLQAVNSDVGKQMAALREFGELSEQEGSGIKLTGPAKEAYEALKKGEYKFKEDAEFISMMKASGISGEQVLMALADPALLKKHGAAIAGNAREQQWDVDIAPNVSMAIGSAVSAESGGKISGKRAQRIANLITKTIRDNAGKKKEVVHAAVVSALKSKEQIPAEEAKRYATAAIASGNVFAEKLGYEGILEAADLHSKDLHTAARKNIKTANAKGAHAEQHASKWMDPIQRTVEGFKRGGLLGAVQGFFNMGENVAPEPTQEQIESAPDTTAGPAAPKTPKEVHEERHAKEKEGRESRKAALAATHQAYHDKVAATHDAYKARETAKLEAAYAKRDARFERAHRGKGQPHADLSTAPAYVREVSSGPPTGASVMNA